MAKAKKRRSNRRDWQCQCGATCFHWRTECFRCQAQRPTPARLVPEEEASHEPAANPLNVSPEPEERPDAARSRRRSRSRSRRRQGPAGERAQAATPAGVPPPPPRPAAHAPSREELAAALQTLGPPPLQELHPKARGAACAEPSAGRGQRVPEVSREMPAPAAARRQAAGASGERRVQRRSPDAAALRRPLRQRPKEEPKDLEQPRLKEEPSDEAAGATAARPAAAEPAGERVPQGPSMDELLQGAHEAFDALLVHPEVTTAALQSLLRRLTLAARPRGLKVTVEEP